MEVIQLAGEHVPERGDDVLGDLDLPVVLDLLLMSTTPIACRGAARPLGVPTSADEVRVDDPGPVGVGDHEPRPAVAAVDGAFEEVPVDLGSLGSPGAR